MPEWWPIEVFHGELSAERWRDAYGSALTERVLDLVLTGEETGPGRPAERGAPVTSGRES